MEEGLEKSARGSQLIFAGPVPQRKFCRRRCNEDSIDARSN